MKHLSFDLCLIPQGQNLKYSCFSDNVIICIGSIRICPSCDNIIRNIDYIGKTFPGTLHLRMTRTNQTWSRQFLGT